MPLISTFFLRMHQHSPLRYPGGKAKVANFMKAIFRRSGLMDGRYIEPYAGGASVALSLLFSEYAREVHINDLDPAIYALWRAALDESEAFCERIRTVPLTIAEWHHQRAIYRDPAAPVLDRGFATFYLNRTNRSGIIANGGPIGGIHQIGNWKIDARFNRQDLAARVERIAAYRDRITLTNVDAAALLADVISGPPLRTLVYLDPPYFVKGRAGLYANFYEPGDHEAIAILVAQLGVSWVVSYDNAPAIRKLYRGARRMVYGLDYTARHRYEGDEVMFFSDDINLPRVPSPASIPTKQLRELERVA